MQSSQAHNKVLEKLRRVEGEKRVLETQLESKATEFQKVRRVRICFSNFH